VPQSRLKQVDQMFGLHPALAPLFPFWDAGTFGAVHAVGQQDADRSHFSAMDAMERADPGSRLRSGWLDRVVGVTDDAGLFTAVASGSSSLPMMMAGPNQEFGMTSLDGVTLAFGADLSPLSAWQSSLDALHAGATNPLAVGPVRGGVGAVATLDQVPDGGTGYPEGALASALSDVARLVRADVGLTVATVDYGDWDMHAGLGGPDEGWMHDKLAELAAAFAAFATDLGEDFGRVTVITLSEFGRRVEENGSAGTDHGYGNAVLLLGGAVNGGEVHGRWPGLGPDQLVDGDLAVTTDYRQLVAEVLQARCGIAPTEVFRAWQRRPWGSSAPADRPQPARCRRSTDGTGRSNVLAAPGRVVRSRALHGQGVAGPPSSTYAWKASADPWTRNTSSRRPPSGGPTTPCRSVRVFSTGPRRSALRQPGGSSVATWVSEVRSTTTTSLLPLATRRSSAAPVPV
jgi:uncharacterized protein (DUF1501 family)